MTTTDRYILPERRQWSGLTVANILALLSMLGIVTYHVMMASEQYGRLDQKVTDLSEKVGHIEATLNGRGRDGRHPTGARGER